MAPCWRAALVLWSAGKCWAEEAEACTGEECAAVLLLQDRLSFHADAAKPLRGTQELSEWELGTQPLAPIHRSHSGQDSQIDKWPHKNLDRGVSLAAAVSQPRSATSLLQAEVEELQSELAAEEQLLQRRQLESRYVVTQSARHFTGVLIGLVMLGSVLIFGICMSMSLGLWHGGESSSYRRRVSSGDWAVGIGVTGVLLILQLCAFHQIGFLHIPSEGDFSPEIVALSILISCAGPVACLACFKCHTSLEHLDDEFGVVEQRFDRLEKIVSAGFSTSLREEQELLDSIKRQLGGR